MNKIRINDTGIPRGVVDLVNSLPAPSEVKAGDAITLEFGRDEFAYLTGLVLIAAWRKALPSGVSIHLDDSHCSVPTQRFLTNTGFREVIDTGHETPSAFPRVGRVPLRPITNQFAKEATVNDIVSIFDEYAGHVEDTNPFRVLLSELCENVLAHSEFVSPGYVCARVLDKSLKAEIAIADTGIGIAESYQRGTNASIKQRIAKGASPLELAVDGLNSSKPIAVRGSARSYYGFGLLIARRLIEENRGQLFLISGDESLQVDRFGKRLDKLSHPWNGTFIGLVIDLGNPLPLGEIYEQATELMVPAADTDSQSQTVSRPPKTPSPEPQGTDSSAADESASGQEARCFDLQNYGTELLTRDAGTAIRADIAGLLAAGYDVEVVLDGITDLTPSVADEAFAKLADVMGHDAFKTRVRFTGGSVLAGRLVEFVLKTRRARGGG